ncbi:MAG: SEC-C metal-binding domain-containing protein, partial [Nocardioidaceae bacterium]
ELVALPTQRQFGQDKRDSLTQFCLDCDVRFACNGGCPKDRFANSPSGEPRHHYLCPGYLAFFHHVRTPMEAMAELIRRHRAPAGLMEVYAREDAARGRNDPCTCGSGVKWKKCHGPVRPTTVREPCQP